MGDLPDLMTQRAELDRQIRAAQQDEADSFNEDLDALYGALTTCLQDTGLPFYERERKVTVIISIDERVSVEFGYQRGECRGHLAVTYSERGRAEFRESLPPAAAFTGFIRGLLDSQES